MTNVCHTLQADDEKVVIGLAVDDSYFTPTLGTTMTLALASVSEQGSR